MTSRRHLIKLASAGLLGAALFTTGCSEPKPSFNAVDITGAEYAKGFEVNDHNGKLRHLTDFAGKVVVMFFGYTQCPDVCPTTMADMAEIKKMLGADGERLQVLFVTVDPDRDTPEMLKAYMENFDPSFLALVAPQKQLEALTKDFKIYYKKVEGKTPTSYSMDHSAGSYIYDPKGQIRLFSRYGTPKDVLAKDLQTLLKGA
jgi:protein SCO1/2